MYKILTIVLSVWHAINGFFMLMMPARWYELVPGVVETGPYNSHFVADVAIAFLASAIGLALATNRRGAIAAGFLAAPAIFLGGHSLLHVVEFFHGAHGAIAIGRDTLTILVPGLLPAVLALQALRAATQGDQ